MNATIEANLNYNNVLQKIDNYYKFNPNLLTYKKSERMIQILLSRRENWTLKRIGKALKISESRVAQLESLAITIIQST